jgi:tyrosine-protein kinase Etk/Wzc
MNEAPNSQDSPEVKSPGLDIAVAFAGYKRLWLGLPFVTAILALGISYGLPNWYTATTRIMPPQQSQSNAVAILGQLGAITGGNAQTLGLKNPSEIYIVMLKSRSVADGIITKFDLLNVYGDRLMADARNRLGQNSTLQAGREGVITIEVTDKSADRAANLANAYVEELRKLTLNLAISEAGQRRLFFDEQLKGAKVSLAAAEVELKNFIEKSGIPSVEGQLGLSVAAAAALRAQITAKEIQLSSMRTFATETNPEIRRSRQELDALRAELAKMESNAHISAGDVLLPFSKAGALGLEYKRRFRDLKYNEALFEALAKQYEIAKIDEAKDATLIQVLDKALVPEQRSWPRRGLITALAFFISLLLSTASIVALIWLRQVRSDARRADKLNQLIRSLRTHY